MPVAAENPKATKKGKSAQVNWYPLWAPRFWHGMALGDYLRLLARNRFRIHPLRWPMALIIFQVSLFNTVMNRVQRLIYGRGIDATPIDQPPVFVIGHWRSGTTMLHELLVLDERFGYPTTYECFAPNHFCITGSWIPSLMWFLLPSKRPMDNMAVSFQHPQEDEFALVTMGAPTPVLRIAFPNEPPPHLELLDMQDVPPRDLAAWKQGLTGFVRALTYHKGKPLVLKSPPHTGRVGVLAEMFPGAKFIHISRDPYALFSSTRRLWQALDEAQAFQIPRHEQIEEYVYTALPRMYAGLHRQRPALASNQICDVRYEELVQDPVGVLRRVYEQLELGDFESVRERIEAYAGERKDYQPNRHEIDPQLKAEIRRRWSDYIETYGYAED